MWNDPTDSKVKLIKKKLLSSMECGEETLIILISLGKKKKSCLFIVIRGLYSSFYIRDANNCIQKVKKEYLED